MVYELGFGDKLRSLSNFQNWAQRILHRLNLDVLLGFQIPLFHSREFEYFLLSIVSISDGFPLQRMEMDAKGLQENLLFVNETFTVLYDRIMEGIDDSDMDKEAKEAVRKFHEWVIIGSRRLSRLTRRNKHHQ